MTDPAVICARITVTHYQHAGQPMPDWLAEYVRAVLSGSASGTKTLTTKQVASKLGISTRAVVKQAANLGGRKVGRQWLFDWNTVEYVRRQRSTEQRSVARSVE